MKFLKITFFSLLSFLIVFVLTMLYIVQKNEQEIKQYAIKELNKKLNAPVEVRAIDLSIWKRFPNVTLGFGDVKIKSSIDLDKNQTSNLLEVENVLLQFNIIKLLKQEYVVDKIELREGKVNVIVNPLGENNFNIWKSEVESSESSNFSLALDNFLLRKIHLNYTNIGHNENLNSYIPNLNLSGDFSENIFELKTFGQIKIHQAIFSNLEYVKNQNVVFDIILKINNPKNEYNIERGKISVENLNFSIVGNVKQKDEKYYSTDIKIDGNQIALAELSKASPQIQNLTKNYKIQGLLAFKAHLSGEFGQYTRPSLDVDFSFENASLLDKSNAKINVEAVNLKGIYSTGKNNTATSNFLNISNFEAVTAGSKISGAFEIENFEVPKLRGNIKAVGKAKEIFAFFGIQDFNEVDGNLSSNLNFTGRINSFNSFTKDDFEKLQINGNLVAENFSLSVASYNNPLSNVNANLSFKNSSVLVRNLEGKIKDSDFQLQGRIDHLLSYALFQEGIININAKLQSEQINLTQLLTSADSKTEGGEFSFALPSYINFKFSTSAKGLVFNKFKANDVNVIFDFRDNKFSCNDIALSAFDGELKGNCSFNFINENNIKYVGNISVNNTDIQKIIYQLEGFGQDFITEKHLRGKLDGNAQFSLKMNSKLNIDPKSIVVNSHLKITNGELVDFETLESLSEYIHIDELKHVKFSTLENDIYIKNEVVEIPLMEINSSAFNLKLSGKHTFDNKIDYHFGVYLKEILAAKAQKKKKENIEYGQYDPKKENKLTLFVGMNGTVENPNFYYEKIGVKDKFKQDLKTEKETVKSLLKEEFNLFKSDTTIKSNTKKEDFNYEIEWEEDDKQEIIEIEEKQLSPVEKALQQEEKKKKKSWLEKITKENEKGTEEFDDFDPNED